MNSETPGDEREELLQDIVAGYLERLDAGTAERQEELLTRHPAFAAELEEFFAVRDRIDGVAAPFRRAVGQVEAIEGTAQGGCLGDFRIVREVGRGGMGIVYEAEQISLLRRVALKVLPFAATMDTRHLQRFHNEARAAACLHHPNIVPIHAVGSERGVHYYAMQFIEGRTLGDVIQELRGSKGFRPGSPVRLTAPGRPSPPFGSAGGTPTVPAGVLSTDGPLGAAEFFRTAVHWGVQAAEALEYAHQQGVVHRDIKPANLLLDERGQLWITDFGLARFPTEAGLTVTGDLIGTLRYMSPEQALGKRALIDHRTDIYSLGATLYELLTLRPAFTGQDREEVLRQVAFEEPPPPRQLDRTIPVELETIVLKAMTKEPAGRYAAAQELADDLRCYLEHRPIKARRPTLADRLAKWGRRHRPLVLAATVFLLLALVGLTAAILLIAHEQTETARARDLALERERSQRQMIYAQDISLAWQALREAELERMQELLDRHVPEAGEEDMRGFEWWYLQKRSHGVLREAVQASAHEGDVYCVTYSPDGRTLASAGKDGLIRLWDSTTLRVLREIHSGQGEVNEVVFTPDGKTVASAGDDGTVRLWDIGSAKQRAILRMEGRRDELNALALSPDGKVIVAGGSDGRAWSWDAESGTLKAARNLGTGAINYLAFAPDGRTVASASNDHCVLLLDPATLRERGQFHYPGGPMNSLAFNRDGRALAAGSSWSGRIILWDRTMTMRFHRPVLLGHDSNVESLSFSPDDTLLASGGRDGRVKLWDIRSGGLLASMEGQAGRIWCVTFAPDGARLATARQDGIIKLWNVHRDDHRTIRMLAETKNRTAKNWAEFLPSWLAFAPDGQTLLTRTSNGELQRWSVLSGRRAEPAGEPVFSATSPALSSRSRLASVEGGGRDLRVQNLSGGAMQVYRHEHPISYIAISSNGEQVAFRDASPAVWVWEVASGQPRQLARLSQVRGYLPLAADGGTVAVVDSGRILLLDKASGQLIARLAGHEKGVSSVVFSPDGRRLATSGVDGMVRIWDCPSGRERYCFWKHRGRVSAMAFSPDGKTLASGGDEGKVILWNIAGGQELMSLDEANGEVRALAFSPDGKALAAANRGSDGKSAEVTLWYGEGVRPEP